MFAVLSYRVSIGACASSYRMSMGENPWLLGCLLITFSQICRTFSLLLSRAATGDAQLEVNKLRSNQNADFRLSAQYSSTIPHDPVAIWSQLPDSHCITASSRRLQTPSNSSHSHLNASIG